MQSKSTKSCCTWPRFLAFIFFVGGVVCIVYFLTPLGSLAKSTIDDGFGNGNNGTETDTGDKPTNDGPPTASPTALSSYEFFQCDENTDLSTCCNSLDGLCEFRINEILWPVSHNSMAALDNGFLLFPNHINVLEESLDAGYRGLDLDVCNCGGSYTLCHGECSLGQRDVVEVFQHVVGFLQNNPTETILLTLELNSDADQAVVLNDFASLVLANVPGFEERLYVQDDISQPWPTLGDLKSTGKNLVLFHHRGPDCVSSPSDCPAGFHHMHSSVVETPFDFRTPEDLLDTSASCALDRGSSGTRSFFLVNAFTTLPDISEARTINQQDFLETHMDACSNLNGGLQVNMIQVDFWHVGNVLQTVQENNRALIQRRRALLADGSKSNHRSNLRRA